MNKIIQIIPNSFVQDIKTIIGQARTHAVRSVEFHRVQMYWKVGERIFNEEQQGKERADYGTYLIRNLAKELEPEYGSGFSYRQLNWCRQFYCEFPIVSALRTQLYWMKDKITNWIFCSFTNERFLPSVEMTADLLFSGMKGSGRRSRPLPFIPYL